MKQAIYVTASEIGDYVFCKRGWWLRTQGLVETTPEMQRGTAAHGDIANQLSALGRLKLLALIFFLLGLIFLVMILGYRWLT